MTDDERKVLIWIAIIATIVAALAVFFFITPSGRAIWNKNAYDVHMVDDATNYHTRKQVEDSCRAMIVSYISDKMTYETYKTSDDKEKLSWAEQAKIRANKTVANYNEYILKNRYVWNNNVPDDIKTELPYIE
jgi:hypothetical protein